MMKFIKSDLHIHSQFSDGKLSIPEIVDLYGKKGYGAIAITDHLCEKNSLIGQVSHHLKYSLTKSTFPFYIETIKYESMRAWEQYGMLLLPGFEITKNSFINHRSAHILIIGCEEYIAPELPVEEILSTAKKFGALTVAAHPFDTGDFEFQTYYLWSRRENFKNCIDAWEVNSRKKICKEILNSGLPLLANSDFHNKTHMSSWKTKVFCDKNISSLFESIRMQKIDFFMET